MPGPTSSSRKEQQAHQANVSSKVTTSLLSIGLTAKYSHYVSFGFWMEEIRSRPKIGRPTPGAGWLASNARHITPGAHTGDSQSTQSTHQAQNRSKFLKSALILLAGAKVCQVSCGLRGLWSRERAHVTSSSYETMLKQKRLLYALDAAARNYTVLQAIGPLHTSILFLKASIIHLIRYPTHLWRFSSCTFL